MPQHNSTASARFQPTAIALFSGGGGLDIGFAAAGFDIRVSTDIDTFSCQTLTNNMSKKRFLPRHPVLASDIRELTGKDILRSAGLERGEVDVVFGGPPCQSFSVFGLRKGLADPRGGLIWEFHKLVRALKPKVFVFENVYGLVSANGGQILRDLTNQFSENEKYNISSEIYELADYGIPQWRKRLFIVGVRGNRMSSRLPLPNGDGAKSHRPSWDVLKQMPAPGSDLPNHRKRNHSSAIIRRYSKMQFGMRDTQTRINRLHPDKPSFTIVVGSDQGGGKGHIHPYEAREITPRESARLQTFPDWWEFAGNVRHMIRQIGNAVPPLFAAQLAAHIKQEIFCNSFRKATINVLAKRIGLDYIL